MTKLKSYLRFLSELANVNRNEWQVAIRERSGKTLYEGEGSGFYAVKNTIRYWFADPFLFSHSGKDYLFVEMFDRWKEKGVIGVCRIRNGKCKNFHVCLETPFHLSYPCIYEDNNEIYMIPECYQSGEVWIYRCAAFPYRWEKDRLLLKGFAVDTTPCFFGKERFWLTTQFDSPCQRINDNLWQIDDLDGAARCLVSNDYSSRGAGHIISENDCFIRPSQNCSKSYGEHLVFNRGYFKDGTYHENPFMQVYPPTSSKHKDAITVECCNVEKRYSGLHTYNISKHYEVIDLRLSEEKNCLTLIKRWGKHISQKLGIKHEH